MDAQMAKRMNIIDMAVGFGAMVRLFCEGSKSTICDQLAIHLETLSESKSSDIFETRHQKFCNWATDHLWIAERRKGEQVTERKRPSYGQVAKILDVAAKVYVYYCQYPDTATASAVKPFLHCAIDAPILASLKKQYSQENIRHNRLSEIDQSTYRRLQDLIKRHIIEEHQGQMVSVEYDDVYWRIFNRLASPHAPS